MNQELVDFNVFGRDGAVRPSGESHYRNRSSVCGTILNCFPVLKSDTHYALHSCVIAAKKMLSHSHIVKNVTNVSFGAGHTSQAFLFLPGSDCCPDNRRGAATVQQGGTTLIRAVNYQIQYLA